MSPGAVTEAGRERAALCDTFEQSGPEAPTLCGGRVSLQLLAYLLVNERRFLIGLVGLAVPSMAVAAESRMASLPWLNMVELLRSGRVNWLPGRRPTDGLEFLRLYVHHEDLRRAVPDWAPRPPEVYRDDTLWHAAAHLGRLAYRRSPVGVLLESPEGGRWEVRAGPRAITLRGRPGELVVHMCRRPSVAVETIGPRTAVDLALAARPGTLFGGFATSRPPG